MSAQSFESATMSSPPTPIHPGPNEEVRNLPNEPLPSETLEDIDLNPDLCASDDDELEDVGLDTAEFQPPVPIHDEEYINDKPNNGYQVTVPFDSAYNHLENTFLAQPVSLMSEEQQSKLINYMDETILKIQRQFVRNQAEEIEIYLLQQLVTDLKKVVDVLFVSVGTKSPLFGQAEYYIKLMTDLEDFVAHYRHIFEVNLVSPILSPSNHHKLICFLTLMQTLDVHLSFLIDGYTTSQGTREKLSATGLVRLIPIASRLRILIISKLEPIRLKLLHVVRSASTSDQVYRESRETLNLLDLEIGRIFEGVLDRG